VLPPHCPYSATVPVLEPDEEDEVDTATAAAAVDDLTTVWRVVLALHADLVDSDAAAEETTAATAVTEEDLALQADFVEVAKPDAEVWTKTPADEVAAGWEVLA
jgi:hypothetical protein